MRILHIVTAFPRDESDVITPWLVELLRRLRARGYDAEVFTSAYRGTRPADFQGIPVHRFRYFFRRWEDLTHDEAAPDRVRRSWRYRITAMCYVAFGAVAIWRLCRRRRYEVIQVHWPLPHALFGWSARAASGARSVLTFYGVELRLAATGPRPLRWFLAQAARRADRVVAISRYTAAEVQRLGRQDVSVIPYGVGVPPAGDPTSPRDPVGERPFTAVFVGRLVPRKGVDVLLQALRKMSRTPSRAVVVGTGPEAERLRALAVQLEVGDRVRFVGRVSDRELGNIYRLADAVVLPAVVDARSDTEGLGVVLLEGMQYGVPAVGSEVGGIPDIVEHEASGLLVRPGDPDALAAALTRLAHDPALARRLGEAGRERVRRVFGWPAIVERWATLYDSLAHSPPGSNTVPTPDSAPLPAPSAPPHG
ncbi:MAG TPA: glycosyltransferase family 4 protein [Gemmatimonadales bacterium]|nr:glycosyltransferase family 4 protein [Gemmatimonadales bacterium]